MSLTLIIPKAQVDLYDWIAEWELHWKGTKYGMIAFIIEQTIEIEKYWIGCGGRNVSLVFKYNPKSNN